MKKKRYIKLFLVLSAVVMITASCAPAARYVSDSFFAMDTLIEIKLAKNTADAGEIFRKCRDITSELEKKLSAEDGASDIARFNMSGGGCVVSPEVGEIFMIACDVVRASGGAFDPTTYPATLMWRGAEKNGVLPTDDEIARAAEKCGISLIAYDPESGMLSKKESWVMLDLGGVGKGYAEAKVVSYLESTDAAYGVLSFGGNISVFGEHPDKNFTIALRDPVAEAYAGNISVADGFISVSGGYERYYEIDGKKYCHIIDPRTGKPVSGRLLSAAVISGDGAAADALSTALFAADTTDAALALYNAQSKTALSFEAILIYENEIYITPGLKDSFSLSCGRTLKVLGS